MRAPDSKRCTYSWQAMKSLSSEARPSRHPTESRRRRFSSRCFSAFSRRTCWKTLPSATQQLLASLAVMVAVLGHLQRRAMPPKHPPREIVFTHCPFTLTSRAPSWSTKKAVPTSPCLTRCSPGENSQNAMVSRMASISSLWRRAHRGSCFKPTRISSRVSWPLPRWRRACCRHSSTGALILSGGSRTQSGLIFILRTLFEVVSCVQPNLLLFSVAAPTSSSCSSQALCCRRTPVSRTASF
mmetsp:Transcript_21366/g.60522  ORF Transcript_21366/g.60522 Transcript_21366/m.60522 type:complete len:241 (+) Transcript_21366:2048-2770(+)